MKLPKLPKLPSLKSLHLPSRITMERLLIVSAAALVVVLAVRAVLCPAFRQPHEPLTFRFRGKADAAPGGIVLVPKGKGRNAAR